MSCKICGDPADHDGIPHTEAAAVAEKKRGIERYTSPWPAGDMTTFAGLATKEREKAACRRRSVGCVVVKDGRVIGRGHNRARHRELNCLEGDCPRGLESYEDLPAGSPYDNCVAIHAEEMALTEAGADAAGSLVYVTCSPCADCSRLLDAAKVGLVIVEHDEADPLAIFEGAPQARQCPVAAVDPLDDDLELGRPTEDIRDAVREDLYGDRPDDSDDSLEPPC